MFLLGDLSGVEREDSGERTRMIGSMIASFSGPSVQPTRHTAFFHQLRVSTMGNTGSWRREHRDRILVVLTTTIDAINVAKDVATVTPVKAVLGSVSIILTMIRVRFLFFEDLSHAHMQPGLHGQ